MSLDVADFLDDQLIIDILGVRAGDVSLEENGGQRGVGDFLGLR